MKSISKEVYTIEEVARMLKISTATVRRRIKSGDLHSNKIGKLYRVREKDLMKYLEATKTEIKEKIQEEKAADKRKN